MYPYTPEKNGIVEIPFGYLYGNVRTILNCMTNTNLCNKELWAECEMTDTFLDVILIKEKNNPSIYEQYFKRKHKLIRNFHKFWG